MNFDPLSDVLRAVRLREAVFFDVEANAPWAAEAPHAQVVGPGILPGVDHVMAYHVVTSGECWVAMAEDGAQAIRLTAGDAVAFPHGEAHVLSSRPGMRADPVLDNFRPPAVPDSLPVRFKLGGNEPESVHLVCGFLGCDARPFNPLLSALPHMMHMRGDKNGGWIDRFMKFATMETAERRVGGASILAKLGEIMFIDLVRHHLANLPEDSANWLAGLRDRQVGRAVSLLHQSPADNWTLERLAKETGLSRSSLAERFQRHVGHPPMQVSDLVAHVDRLGDAGRRQRADRGDRRRGRLRVRGGLQPGLQTRGRHVAKSLARAPRTHRGRPLAGRFSPQSSIERSSMMADSLHRLVWIPSWRSRIATGRGRWL